MDIVNFVKDIGASAINFESVNKKMETLKRKVEVLEGKEADITSELKEAESRGSKRQKTEVNTWLGHVANLKNDVQQREQKVRARGWVISNITELFQKDVDRLVNEATELVQNGNFAEGLTVKADERVLLLTTDLVGQEFETNKNTICQWLMSDESLIVGLYGLGGVGKTTLLKHIYNQLRADTSVYWVTASQQCSISELRNRIAEEVGLALSKSGEEKKKAAKLARALSGQRGIVLILDDVWKCFPADEVGFPIGVNGFKLILSTRSLEICRKMNCQYPIKVEPLSAEAAWELFLETLGRETSLPPQIEVMLVTSTQQLNPNTFKDPLEFNPWRWKELDPYVVSKNFMAFGGGMRQCAGAEYSKVFAATFLPVLFTKYSWRIIKAGKISRDPILGFGKGIDIKFSEKEN